MNRGTAIAATFRACLPNAQRARAFIPRATRGRISEIVPATRRRPGFAHHNEAMRSEPLRTVLQSNSERSLSGPLPAFFSTRFRQIKEAERRQTCFETSASCDAARIRKDALACRRSTAALTVGALARSAQLQARFPGTWQDVRPCTGAPTGGRRPRAIPRALPAPACPSPGKHLPDRS